MAENERANDLGLLYPLTKMNFLVTVPEAGGTAAFTSVSGIEATVAEIPFRQGNSHSLAPIKLPGLVNHSNVTMKMGLILNNAFKQWVIDCVSEQRKKLRRSIVNIELLDTFNETPNQKWETLKNKDSGIWVLTNAWVTQYSGPDLDASDSGVAIESITIVYEELKIPK